ncbi:hypothetical protein BDV95DRAFT_588111, partial [Massariosphaeria phaeospora]
MDLASRALVQTLPAGVPDTYAARSEHSNEQAQRKQYLSREEKKALVQFLLLMSNLGHP